MENPITRIQKERKLSRAQMARRVQCCYAQLKHLEQGYRVKLTDLSAKKIAEAFSEDPKQLQEEYQQWRRAVNE